MAGAKPVFGPEEIRSWQEALYGGDWSGGGSDVTADTQLLPAAERREAMRFANMLAHRSGLYQDTDPDAS